MSAYASHVTFAGTSTAASASLNGWSSTRDALPGLKPGGALVSKTLLPWRSTWSGRTFAARAARARREVAADAGSAGCTSSVTTGSSVPCWRYSTPSPPSERRPVRNGGGGGRKGGGGPAPAGQWFNSLQEDPRKPPAR